MSDVLDLGGLAVDLARLLVVGGEAPIRLSAREGELLAYLAARGGAEISRRELLTHVWGYHERVESRAVDNAVQRLRVKIERDPANPRHLLTAAGGYRLLTGAATPSRPTFSPPPTRWFGRERELAALEEWARQGGLLALVGPPGSGKSRLASELAARVGLHALRVPLSGARGVDDVVAALAGALGLTLGRGEAWAQLGRAIRARGPALLVLDDAEAVADDLSGPLGAVRVEAPEARLLVTSRHQLPGERSLALPALDPAAAAALFLDRAAMARPGVQQDPEVVAALVARLDLLPLAIELAAARVRVLGARQILERLDQRLKLLTGGTDPRGATLRGAIDGSWELLDDDERRVLAGVSVFRGGFALPAAEAVLESPGVVGTLRSLADKSLIRAGEGDRLDLGGSVGDYAAEKLATSGHGAACGARHRAWFAAQARSAKGRGESAAVGGLLVERSNLVAALEGAVAAGDPLAAPLALGLVALHVLRGPVDRGAAFAEAALAVSVDDDDRISLLDAVARCTYRTGDLPRALAASEEALALSRAGSPTLQSACLHGRALVVLHAGRTDEAEACLREGLALATAAGDLRLAGLCRASLGHVAVATGRPALAEEVFAEALDAASGSGDLHAAALARGNLANLARRRGDLATAEGHYRACLDLAVTLGDQVTELMAVESLGLLAYDAGRYEVAAEHLRAALGRMRLLGHGVGTCVGNLALALRALGRFAEARACHDEAVATLRREGYVRQIAIALGNRALQHLIDDRVDDAWFDLTEALGLVSPDDRAVRGAFLGPLAECAERRGAPDLADARFAEASELLERLGDRHELSLLRARRGWVAWRRGLVDTARIDLASATELAPSPDPDLARLLGRLGSALAGTPPAGG